jgi:hypothetical protein
VPDYGNEVLLTKLLPCIAWIAWAMFAIPFVFELGVKIAGRTSRKKFWLFRSQQRMAAALVGAVFVMFTGAATLAAPATAIAEPLPADTLHTATATYEAPAPPAPAPAAAAAPARRADPEEPLARVDRPDEQQHSYARQAAARGAWQ